jgi:hypothetical protein
MKVLYFWLGYPKIGKWVASIVKDGKDWFLIDDPEYLELIETTAILPYIRFKYGVTWDTAVRVSQQLAIVNKHQSNINGVIND